MKALSHLLAGGESLVANCGYGHGASVRDVVETVGKVAGLQLDVRDAERREGDAAILVADSTRLRNLLGWKPAYDDLDKIIADALAWERDI